MSYSELADLLLDDPPPGLPPLDRRREAILERIAVCRTPQLGGSILSCNSCGAQIVVYNPCHQRGCPKCASAVQYQWSQRAHLHLLPIPHFHLIFSGPDSLVPAWRFHPKLLIDCLFAAANRTLQLEAERCGLRFGFMIVFHSHGLGLSYKPHLHCVLTADGLDTNGSWRPHHRLSERLLRSDFSRFALQLLAKHLPASLLAPIHRQPPERWSLYCVYHRHNPNALIDYFARSLHGMVVNSHARFSVCSDSVTFTCEHLGLTRTTTLSRQEFLTRYFAHIPPKGTVTVRHYGLYANRHCQQLKELAASLLDTPPEDSEAPPPEPPHLCPLCHQPLTVALSFPRDDLPPLLSLAIVARGSPFAHGEIIQPVPVSA